MRVEDWDVQIDPYEQKSTYVDELGIWYAKWYFWATFGLFLALNFFYTFAHYNSMTPLWLFVGGVQMIYIYMCIDIFVPSQLLDFY